jgi:hypothetical protein
MFIMKKILFNLSAVVLLTLFASSVFAQDYCMWVVNNRVDALNELKVKETTASVFSEDLLPSTTITQGTPFWIRVTNWSNSLGDVQFTDMDGSPLMFTLNTTSGGTADFPYIRINIKDIHTLVLNEDNTFSVYNDDRLGLGHPCDN